MSSEHGLCEKLQEYGCPMMDDTSWSQSGSGESFTSPDGIGTAASWLPCVAWTPRPPIVGTCDDCESYRRARLQSETPPSEDGA